MTRWTTEKRTGAGRGRRLRQVGAVAIGMSGAAMVLTAGIGAAADEADNGRQPGAVPGAVSDASSPVGPVSDGRSAAEVAGRGQARSATTGGSIAAYLDNGRGGPDPASGPNAVVADVARSAIVVEGGIDTDSGVLPAPDASSTAAPASEPSGADQDEPGSSTPAQAGDDLGRAAPEQPVDLDS